MNTNTERPSREILSYSTRQRLKRDMESAEREMRGGVSAGRGTGMPDRMQRRLEGMMETLAPDPAAAERYRRAKRALAEGSPADMTDAERLQLEKVKKEYEEWAPKLMMPERMKKLKGNDAGFKEAVKLSLQENSQEFQKRTEAYQSAMRQLEPENPEAGSIEALRPQ